MAEVHPGPLWPSSSLPTLEESGKAELLETWCVHEKRDVGDLCKDLRL